LSQSGSRWRFGLLGVFLGAGAVAALIGLWDWSIGGQRLALRALPAAERTALYQRTLENLRAICGAAPPSGLESFCRDQARLALVFDECDDACRSLAGWHGPRPTR
jgi:hypothetical protein